MNRESGRTDPQELAAGARASAPPPDLLHALAALKRPLLAGHVTPDADCIGACAGLALVLRDGGADAAVALPGGVAAKKLDFLLDLAGRALFCEGAAEGRDALIVLDTAGPRRVNAAFPIEPVAPLPVINIDHHLSNPAFGRANWIDAQASSTSELVFRLLVALDRRPSPAAASLLYAGIHGDTAGFSLPNTSAACLHAAAELVRAGADVGLIGERLCRSQQRSDFELLRIVYDRTQLAADGRIAHSHVTHEDIRACRCSPDDIDDQVSVPRSLAGVRIALLFSEAEQGVVRINLRGEGDTSVLPIAQAYGGGGHAQSAGVRVRNKPIELVIQDVVAAAARYLDHGRV